MIKKKDISAMERQVNFILMKAGVSAPEIDECITWAFGPDAWYVPIAPDWIIRWNKLHPHVFQLQPKDKFVDVLYVIGRYYLAAKYKGGGNGRKR